MTFKYGFDFPTKDNRIIKYVWDDSQQNIYRLPYKHIGKDNKEREFTIHKIIPHKYKNVTCYIIGTTRKSRGKLLSISKVVDTEVDILPEFLP